MRHWNVTGGGARSAARLESSKCTTSRLLSMAAHPSRCPTRGPSAGAVMFGFMAVYHTKPTQGMRSWCASFCRRIRRLEGPDIPDVIGPFLHQGPALL